MTIFTTEGGAEEPGEAATSRVPERKRTVLSSPSRPVSVYRDLLWYARSDADPHRFYIVSIDPRTELYICECPDHQVRRRDCKHIKRVQSGLIRPGKPRTVAA
jgi:hypothetical protein